MLINQEDFTQFITVQKGVKEGSARTCLTRLSVINRFFIGKDFNSKNIEAFFYFLKTEKKLKQNTLVTYVFALRYVKDYLKDRGMGADFHTPTFRKEHPPIIPLTDEEIERLLSVRLEFRHTIRNNVKNIEALSDSVQGLATFLAYTGCRFDEAASLTVQYVDIPAQRAMIHKTKNSEFRFVYFTESLTTILKRQIKEKKPSNLTFPNYWGKKHHNGDFNERLREMAKTAGITKYVSAHKLRHSFGTTQYEAGNDIAMVATLLGHKDIQTTYDTYVHLADKAIRQATYKHPSLSKHISPLTKLEQIEEDLRKHRINESSAFSEKFKKGLMDLFYKEGKRLREEEKKSTK